MVGRGERGRDRRNRFDGGDGLRRRALFPKLRQADALTAESLLEAERELSVAEPVN